jgi:hypothetical protein
MVTAPVAGGAEAKVRVAGLPVAFDSAVARGAYGPILCGVGGRRRGWIGTLFGWRAGRLRTALIAGRGCVGRYGERAGRLLRTRRRRRRRAASSMAANGLVSLAAPLSCGSESSGRCEGATAGEIPDV